MRPTRGLRVKLSIKVELKKVCKDIDKALVHLKDRNKFEKKQVIKHKETLEKEKHLRVESITLPLEATKTVFINNPSNDTKMAPYSCTILFCLPQDCSCT
ncbi:hypothetical protein VNO77_23304 [Canavalia gladiata]|uniref:Uncharacterized protein n=1 Tax=Canavalia gladiata TaxID=3824 RepID=A0AAN9L5L6_CANGL